MLGMHAFCNSLFIYGNDLQNSYKYIIHWVLNDFDYMKINAIVNIFSSTGICWTQWLIDTRQLSRPLCLKLQPHEGDNLDERIVTISCGRVYCATQARPCETSCCLRLRCTVKVSNKTRLFRSHEQLIYPAKKLPSFSLADAADVADFGGTSHLSRMDRKTFACHRKSAQFVTRQRFSLPIRSRVAEALQLSIISQPGTFGYLV